VDPQEMGKKQDKEKGEERRMKGKGL